MGSSSTSRRAATGSRRGVIVEFTGAPGSGKSTLSYHALARTKERGLDVVEGRAIRPVYLETGPMAWFVRNLLPFTSFDHRRRRFYDQIELPLLLPRFAARHPRGWRLLRAELERIDARSTAAFIRWCLARSWGVLGVAAALAALAARGVAELIQ